jgi:hypothetical protein
LEKNNNNKKKKLQDLKRERRRVERTASTFFSLLSFSKIQIDTFNFTTLMTYAPFFWA